MWEQAGDLAAQWIAAEEASAICEYIFILALIAVVAMGALSFLGSAVRRQFDVASEVLNWAGSGDPLPPSVWKDR